MLTNNTPGFETQADKIENLLRSRYGQEIPVYEISALALQYNARINSIRKKLKRAGDVEHIPPPREEWVNGQLHTWYCIRRGPMPAKGMTVRRDLSPPKPGSLKSWDEIVREREEKMRQPEPSFELTP